MNARASGSLGGAIPEGTPISNEGQWVPLYYEDRTIIGKAKIQGNHVEIEIDDPDVGIAARMKEGLVGVSFISRGVSPSNFEEEVTTKGEN